MFVLVENVIVGFVSLRHSSVVVCEDSWCGDSTRARNKDAFVDGRMSYCPVIF